MKFQIDHDYHIHSVLSSCSRDPEQSTQRILQYAKDKGLKEICITDHYWDSAVEGASGWYAPQNFDHISQAKPLPQAEGIRFLFGCETEMDKFMTVGMPLSRFDDFDFVIIPTTHLHMTGFTLSKKDAESNARRAELWVERLDKLFAQPLPFKKIGIAHLACPLLNKKSRQEYIEMLDMIPTADMERVFTKAAELGCGIELNRADMGFREGEKDSVLRMFRIAKRCGCKFYLGSDAHHPAGMDTSTPVFEKAIDLLGLTEDDKYHIGG